MKQGKTWNPAEQQWYYRWRFEPTEARRRRRNDLLSGAMVVLVVGLLVFVAVGYTALDGDSGSAPSSTETRFVPMNSEGRPAVGPIPAPRTDPCWRQTEEAVEISPYDGGQSAMPQRCIDKGF